MKLLVLLLFGGLLLSGCSEENIPESDGVNAADSEFIEIMNKSRELYLEAQPYFESKDIQGFCSKAIERAELLLSVDCLDLSSELNKACLEERPKAIDLIKQCASLSGDSDKQ